MKFSYYPGCSLKGTGKAYEESLLAVLKALDVDVKELEDWNCCGATSYMSVDESSAFALAARNLAKTQQAGHEMLAPCSGCYLVHEKTNKYMKEYPDVKNSINRALKKIGMAYDGEQTVRHPLDVILNLVGLKGLQPKIKRTLKGLKIAPYYGCQIVRPYAHFDDQHNPVYMDRLFVSLGATVVNYPLKTQCCGGSLTGTINEVGLGLVRILLHEAKRRGADIIATLCPLCHFNLDAFQDKVKDKFGDPEIPVVYFTQLLGLALGISEDALGLNRNIVSAGKALEKVEA